MRHNLAAEDIMAKNPAPAARGGIPNETPRPATRAAEPPAAPASFGPDPEHVKRWEAAGEQARRVQAEGGNGDATFRAELAKDPPVPLPPGYEPEPARGGVDLEALDPEDIDPGTAVFMNPTADPVKVVLLDGANRAKAFRWKPNGGREAVPVDYIGIMAGRAPQLVLLGKRAADPIDDGASDTPSLRA